MKRILLGGARGPVAGLLRPLVTVEVRNRFGEFVPIRFCVDSGADTPAMQVPLAVDRNIPFPHDDPSSQRAAGLVGSVAQYRGFIHVRMFDEEFDWPCMFLETPASATTLEYGVLGRLGFATAFNVCIERPYCLIKRRTDHLPAWRRVLAYFAPWRTHPYHQPL